MGFYQTVYEIVGRIPKGKVASYGLVACLAGKPGASRAVGNALHQNPLSGLIPCHRVVNHSGRLAPSFAFGGEQMQRKLLLKEGVVFTKDGFVDMKTCAWDGT